MRIKVLTLNCWGLWLVSKRRRERVRLIAEEIRRIDVDVVILQEVFVKEDIKHLSATAAQGTLKHAQYMHSSFLGGELLILSCWPILYTRFHSFSVGGSPEAVWQGDWIAGKGVGLVCLDTPSGHVQVFNTHTCANYGHVYRHLDIHGGVDFPMDANAPVRTVQILELTDFVRTHGSQGHGAVVVGGDFNCRPDDFEMKLLRTLLPELHDSWALMHPHEPGYTSNSGDQDKDPAVLADPPKRIDYLFGTCKPIEAELVLLDPIHGLMLSDHLGLISTFDLSADSASAARLPGSNELSKRAREHASLSSAVWEQLTSGVSRLDAKGMLLLWSAVGLEAPLLIASYTNFVWVLVVESGSAGDAWWIVITIVLATLTVLLASAIPLQLALSVAYLCQARAMQMHADNVKASLRHNN